MSTRAPVRIGVLGAARIAPPALVRPAHDEPDAVVTAVAARDAERAGAFAKKHGIPRVHKSYEALLADPDIDAVYNPLPNGLHGRWTIAAVEAGKHVLCEKPFTANAAEGEEVAAVARASGLVVMEAFHYRYHALIDRMLEILGSGEIGDVRRIEAALCVPLPQPNDIRWNLALAGGSTMDVGCYTLHLVRTLAGAEPEVRSATAKERRPGVDRFMRAELAWADGRTGAITAAMLSARVLSVGARVEGTEGWLRVLNPYQPHVFHRLVVRSRGKRRSESVARRPSTYAAQLRAFTGAVLRGESFPTNLDDAIANMRAVDACYDAAGLPRRQPTT